MQKNAYSGRVIAKNEQVILHQPKLVSVFGRADSMFLQQVFYWLSSNKGGLEHDNRRWIYNSVEKWSEQLNYSTSNVKRSIKRLKDMGVLLVEKLNPSRCNRTNYYSINFERLNELVDLKTEEPKNHKKPSENMSKMIPTSDQNDPMYIKTKISSEICISSEKKGMDGGDRCDERKINHLEKENNNIKIEERCEDEQTQPPYQLTQKMLHIWNEEVEEGKKNVVMTTDRARFLMAAFIKKFNRNLQKWRQFCRLITKSDFLMGRIKESFKASLDWVLKFTTIERIFEGDFGLRRFLDVLNLTNQPTVEELERLITEETSDDVVKQAKINLLKSIGVLSFTTWFKSLLWEKTTHGVFLKPENTFKFDYIENNFRNALKSLGINIVRAGG